MDKREQIARMAQNKDDEILLAKLYERMTMAQARNIPAVSGFLSKREQMLAQELLRQSWQRTGGADDCAVSVLAMDGREDARPV